VEVGRGGNLQARARKARYQALAEAAHAVGATAIATAHHADDRAETLLIRLMRGAGPRGLGVLPPRAPLSSATGLELIRPFLRARRTSIRAHLERHRVPFATDPSNEDPRFLRTRVRLELMPLLEDLSPGIVDHLVALADQLTTLETAPVGSYPLPRATQAALAELQRTGSRTARVWLPGGLVATADPRARQSTRTPR
jgi:tRNA(Ile)-lysidine synthase